MKKCSRCQQLKSITEFYKRTRSTSGVRSECSKCGDRDYQQYRQTHKEASRNAWFKRMYRLDVQQVEEMYKKLNGHCPICLEKMVIGGSKNNSINIDHDHKNGAVRGLLCSSCNIGIGRFQDNFVLLLRAAKYLQNSLLTKPKESAKVVDANTV